MHNKVDFILNFSSEYPRFAVNKFKGIKTRIKSIIVIFFKKMRKFVTKQQKLNLLKSGKIIPNYSAHLNARLASGSDDKPGLNASINRKKDCVDWNVSRYNENEESAAIKKQNVLESSGKLGYSINRSSVNTQPSFNDCTASKNDAERELDSNLKSREYWFNDPHLLAQQITRILKPSTQYSTKESVQKALDLVSRHTGASNAQVFGTAIKGLYDLKEYSKVWDLYKLMSTRKLEPTQQTFTLLIGSLIHLDFARKEKLKIAKMIQSEMEPSLIHFNSILKLYASLDCFEQGVELYLKMVEMNLIDAYTCAEMFKLCRFSTLESSVHSGKSLKIARNVLQKGQELKVLDERNVLLYLKYLLASNLDIAQEFFRVCKLYFGLPTQMDKGLDKAICHMEMSMDQFTVILQTCSKIEYPALGIYWYELLKGNFENESNDGLLLALAGLYLKSRDCETAYKLYTRMQATTNALEFASRVCCVAASNDKNHAGKWLERANTIINLQKPTFRTIFNLLQVHNQFKNDGKFVIDHQIPLLFETRECLEKSMLNRKMDGELKLRVKAVGICKKMLKRNKNEETTKLLQEIGEISRIVKLHPIL